jgi:hypothetical protein
MKTKKEIEDIINSSWGTRCYHRFSPFDGYPVITDGVFDVAEAAECYWFLNLVGSYQGTNGLDPYFQVWELDVKDNYAVVRGYNDTDLRVTQHIEYTDFPLDKFTVWIENGVMLLPSEH